MKQNSLKQIKLLKLFYLFILALTAILVVPTHIFPQPYFMSFRFPYYLEMMPIFLGVSWPMTFEIYHYVLYALAIIGSFNVLGIIFYPRFKQITLFSSLVGLFLISLMVLFFFFVFLRVNHSTAIIYGLYSVVLCIANFLTFKAFIAGKEALRE